ncbi:hypothetical protein BJ875DRAFT_439298 [Amylocarpus encephaloides]|uniref:Uncharacterized protein n=1 Tax=Amylocarpus encephaloides TaxID=45428 RepID=A0A9P8C8W4_9HELO|nr:hypothetical protein BJ875DRAFT_439298 [Amylocarpus encephaloides]
MAPLTVADLNAFLTSLAQPSHPAGEARKSWLAPGKYAIEDDCDINGEFTWSAYDTNEVKMTINFTDITTSPSLMLVKFPQSSKFASSKNESDDMFKIWDFENPEDKVVMKMTRDMKFAIHQVASKNWEVCFIISIENVGSLQECDVVRRPLFG